jgi:Fur family ferric uptake transcriptional regulator
LSEAHPHVPRPLVTDEEIRTRLRDAGLRVTVGRVAVYSHLLNAHGPLRHGDLVDALDHLHLDQATVYRNLMDLTGAGLVVRTDLGDHTWRFEARGMEHSDGPHPHFVCTVCGDVKCLDEVQVSFTGHDGKVHDFGRPNLQVQLRGTCDACT